MSSTPFEDDIASPWAAPAVTAEPTSEPSIAETLEKERVIKDIISLRDGLRSLLVRVHQTEGDNERLKKDNEMLSVYIDNL